MVIGIILLPVMAAALGLLGGAGVWVVAVLGGVVLGILVSLATVGVLLTARTIHKRDREQLTDALTSLPSSERMMRDLAALLADRRRPRAVLSLHILEGLKRYNDAYGRACGDALLSWLAHKLSAAVGEKGVIYRLRGNEFAILARGDEQATTAVRHAASAALHEAGEGFVIYSSAGEAVLPEEAQTTSEALKLIDHRAHAHLQATKGEAEQQQTGVLPVVRAESGAIDIAELAVAVGRQLELPVTALDALAAAANLRDVGNMAIPSVVLRDTDTLSPDEWRFIRLHTLVGERLLATNFEMQAVGLVVRSSHERWDGTGYPDELKGEAIPLASRILFVCSAFEDMTSARPYRDALKLEAALVELDRGAGTQFDPEVVRAFSAALDDADSEPVHLSRSAQRRVLRVLIADDDPTSRFLLAHAIEAAGHECLTAEDGEEAWDLFRTELPEVVISDSRLPGIDGNELCRRVRGEDGYTYFVISSVIGDLGRIRRGIGAGADEFLTKPIVREELEMRLTAARRAVDLRADTRQNRLAG